MATGFGVGFSPFAPGTLGTLVVGVPVYLVFSHFTWPLYAVTVIAFTFLGIYVSQEAEKLWQKKDPSWIVIDEVVGLQYTLFLVTPTVVHVCIGFLLFRFFDIVKPFPVRWCERHLPGGYGVVGDDVAAGIYGSIVLLLLTSFTGL